MTRHRALALPLACALVAAGALLDGQQRFTSGVEAVRVDVLVTRGNKLVQGLTAADFEVRDRGVVQTIRQIDVEKLPLNVILALDTSNSVAGQRLWYLKGAAQALLDMLREGDRVALLSFSARVRLLAPLTPSQMQIRAAIEATQAEGTTSLRDAAFAGLALREADPGRTLMLLFSDGADTSSWLPMERVIDTANRSDVVVYPVGLRGRLVLFRSPAVQFKLPGRFLEALADATGGRVMMADGNTHLRETFVRTLAEFRARYVLSYEPTGVTASGWHPIEVKLRRTTGKITARRGYFAQ